MSQVIDGTGLTPNDVLAIGALVEPWTNACVGRDWDSLLGMHRRHRVPAPERAIGRRQRRATLA